MQGREYMSADRFDNGVGMGSLAGLCSGVVTSHSFESARCSGSLHPGFQKQNLCAVSSGQCATLASWFPARLFRLCPQSKFEARGDHFAER